jgi:hypothetical protein
MPLPFLKPQRRDAAVMIAERKPDGNIKENADADGDQGLQAAAADMLRAIAAKDDKGLAEAFRAAFEILESQPHEEAGEMEPEEMAE